MKHLLKIVLVLLPGLSFAQNLIFNLPTRKEADSLQLAFKQTVNDTLKMSICDDLANYYIETNTASSMKYLKLELVLARKLNQKLREASALDGLSYLTYKSHDYAESLKYANAGIDITENSDCEKNVWRVTQYAKDGDPHKARLYLQANLYEKLAYLYFASGNTDKCFSNLFQALRIAKSVDDKVGLSFYNGNLAEYYLQTNKLDSAFFFVNKAVAYADESGYKLYKGYDLGLLGTIIYLRQKDIAGAKKYFFQSLQINRQQNDRQNIPYSYQLLAHLYQSTGKGDSAIYYARLALADFEINGNKPGVNEAYDILFDIYKSSGRKDSAFVYLERSKRLSDSLNDAEKAKLSQYINAGFDEQLKVQRLEKDKIQVQTRVRTYVLLAGISVFVIIATILYRNNRNKQKANEILGETLSNLKSTQTQLIQSEKMASLGELTAGIAHEIQNPLNFVNNFAEVNQEMIDELKEELKTGNIDEALAIADDIQQNEEKISHHGKRADSIVKGMLQHSRTGSGEKALININALADEYLRLSYHGLRSKDKDFNTEMITNFDAKLPLINVIPQDIGRVLINLFNNAFYAVNQKMKTAGPDYRPEVSVTTAPQPPEGGAKAILIIVKDNGVGIPDAIKEKIMQPFFTTKPTGEGTGLGLSLTYDMVVKGHGGVINVNSKEGEGSEFIIKLPVS